LKFSAKFFRILLFVYFDIILFSEVHEIQETNKNTMKLNRYVFSFTPEIQSYCTFILGKWEK